MTPKTSATEAQRVIEINRALPFADPIAVGPTYDEDHEEALVANLWHAIYVRNRRQHRGVDFGPTIPTGTRFSMRAAGQTFVGVVGKWHYGSHRPLA